MRRGNLAGAMVALALLGFGLAGLATVLPADGREPAACRHLVGVHRGGDRSAVQEAAKCIRRSR